MLFEVADKSDWRCCRFVPGTPNEQVQEDRRQVNSFLREAVIDLPPIGLFRFRGDDAGGLEIPESVREDVGGDTFTRFLEFLKSAEAADHEIADDEERPAIAQEFEGDADRASGSAAGSTVGKHFGYGSDFACRMQVNLPIGGGRTHKAPTRASAAIRGDRPTLTVTDCCSGWVCPQLEESGRGTRGLRFDAGETLFPA
jgi:hypothetical protein